MEALKKKKRNARPPAIPVSAQEWREINKAFRRMLSGRRIAQRRANEMKDTLLRHGMDVLRADMYSYGVIYGKRGLYGLTWDEIFRRQFAVQRAEVSA